MSVDLKKILLEKKKGILKMKSKLRVKQLRFINDDPFLIVDISLMIENLDWHLQDINHKLKIVS